MKPSPVNRRLAVFAALSLFALAACGGEPAKLAEPVEVQFRALAAPPVADVTEASKAPESTSEDVTRADVHDELGKDLVKATEKFIEAAQKVIEGGQQLSPQMFPHLGYTKAFEAYAELAPEKIAVLPTEWLYFVPNIGCPQIEAARADDPPADAELVACDDAKTTDERSKYLLDKAELDGSDVKSAKAEPDETGPGHRIAITFTQSGAEAWSELTGKVEGGQLAVLTDGTVLAAPTVQERISGGTTHITGSFSKSEAEELAAGIEAGA